MHGDASSDNCFCPSGFYWTNLKLFKLLAPRKKMLLNHYLVMERLFLLYFCKKYVIFLK